VRLVVPALALLLGGAALFLRGNREVETPRPPVTATKLPPPAPAIADLPDEAAEAVVRGFTPSAPSAAPAPAAPAKRRTLNALTAELRGTLGLSDEQRARIDGLLEERERSLVAYEAEVRHRGWFRLADFDLRIRELREFFYDRMAGFLDADQGRRFADLRAELWRKDALSIAVPEEHVVCLD
jgi:hypothetical protein